MTDGPVTQAFLNPLANPFSPPEKPGGDDLSYSVSSVHPVAECMPHQIPGRPKIITLCGSSRFIEVMAVCGWLLEKEEGAAVMGLHLLPRWYTDAAHHIAEEEGVHEKMDALHLQKINMSDEIFVVNVGHYIGESTTREVEHALYTRKIPVRWFTDDIVGHKVREIINNATISQMMGDDRG